MCHTLSDLPLDSLVGSLSDDMGRELLRHTPHLRLERDRAVIFLRHLLEAVHEDWPVLELRPLVVGRFDRYRDVDRLLHRHPTSLADPREAALTTTARAYAAHDALPDLLSDAAHTAGLVDLLAHGRLQLLPRALRHLPGSLIGQRLRVHGVLHFGRELCRSLARERRERRQGRPGGYTAAAR